MKKISLVHFISLIALSVVVIMSCNGPQTKSGNLSEIRTAFKNPPQVARPKVYWWWLNGHVDSVRLKEELINIKNAGLGGVDIFEIGLPPASDPNSIIAAGPAFMSDESMKLIAMAIKEAGKLDLEVGLGVASSWNAGGAWVEPKFAAKTLYASKTSIEGNKEVKVKLQFPVITPDRLGNPRKIEYQSNGRPVYSEEVAVVALPKGAKNLADTTSIINLSPYFNASTEELTWKVPAGSWEVYRYICSNSGEQLIRPSPNSAGPIIDHFDSAAMEMHMMYFINRLRPLIGGDFKKSALKDLYLASYEAKEFTWTNTLPAEFKKLNGYDIAKFIPAIYNKELYQPQTYEAFNFDFLKTFSELMINNHYRKAKEICNANGLQIISEAGGPGHLHHIPVETLKALGSLDIPRGEYWYNREFFKEPDSVVDYLYLVKEIAAASHIYKRGIVEEESFTSYWDWQEGPKDLKVIADRAFCEGMNRLVIHGFTHNPSEFGSPGIAYYAGTHYNDKQTWWPKLKAFNDYLGRVSYILQQANFVSDVLYYYGDKVPNLIPPKNSSFKVGDGYDYEVVNTEILLRDLIVENGELVLPGVGRYKVLTIGNEDAINPDALVKIKSLAAQGAIIVGSQSTKSAGLNHQPQATQKVVSESTDLWTNAAFDRAAKSKIYSSLKPADVLKELKVGPDFSYEGQSEKELDYIHYTKDGSDFYLIRNTTDKWVSKSLSFRQADRSPELWDPVSGEIFDITVFNAKDGVTSLPLSIAPYASYFVVFGDRKNAPVYNEISNAKIQYTASGFYFTEPGRYDVKKGDKSENIDNTISDNAVSGEWTINFADKWGAPPAAVFPSLISWSESSENGIKYFSGIGTYRKTINFDAKVESGDRVFLELGDVAELAEVIVNQKSLGVVWTRPFRVDVTDVIKQGENTLQIEVANTWSNRLTGDGITGEKFTNTNITKANKNITPWGEVPLKKSGLMGPVSLQVVKIVK